MPAIEPINLTQGLIHLSKVDKDVADALQQYGTPAPRITPSGFESLFEIIVSQQISIAAAHAIMERVRTCLPILSAETVKAIPIEKLRQAGLSQRKVEYAKGLADAVLTNQLILEQLPTLNCEEAILKITQLKGFGRWSAEIYLIFSLQNPDIFPADDLAIRVALGKLKKLSERPTPKQCLSLVEHWRPWRSAGAILLWHYYKHIDL